jgi:hypothetical protein
MVEFEGSTGSAPLRAIPPAGGTETGKAARAAPPDGTADRCAVRMARADRYFNDHLRDQRGWYSNKASSYKQWSQRLGLAVIGCGALVTFAQAFATAAPIVVPAVTASAGRGDRGADGGATDLEAR